MSYVVGQGRLKKLVAAFICWAKGYAEFPEEQWKRQTWPEDLGEDITILRCEIPKLLKAPEFIDALNMWIDYKGFGAPVAGGYLEWPCQLYDIFKSFDSLHPKYQVKHD